MVFDGAFKLVHPLPKPVVDSFGQLGYDLTKATTIGLLSLISAVLYIIPRTSVLGAVLLTGYLGGAVAENFRLDLPLASHVLFPTYVGVLLWGGLYLRDLRLRKVFPLSSGD